MNFNIISSILTLTFLLSPGPVLSNEVDHTQFRNTFIQSLGTHVSKDSYDKLIYMPVKEMFKAPKSKTVESFISTIDDNYRKLTPSRLFQNGSAQSYRRPLESFNQVVEKGPLTIVIVPGIFSEFIKTRAFEELFRNDNSQYQKIFSNTLRRKRPYDQFTSLRAVTLKNKKLPLVNAPLNRFISVSNIGENLKVVILRSPEMSLESVGSIEHKAKIYNRRLDKFFTVMGTPKNIAFLGYSRGAMIALEMLAQMKESKSAWLKNVKAMVSLGGVTYGSDSADLAQCKNPTAKDANPSCATLHLIKNLANQLEYIGQKDSQSRWSSLSTAFFKANVVARNNRRWNRFFSKMSEYNSSFKDLKFPENISIQETAKMFQQISSIISSKFDSFKGADSKSTSELIMRVAFEVFNIDQFFSNHDKNIKKFKLLVEEVYTGVIELATSERLKWWRENNLPTKGIHYYALAGTMANPKASTLGINTTAYNPTSIDFKTLSPTYVQYVADTQFRLNDSQVAVHKVKFWPELNALLNPYYVKNPIKTTFLGVLGVHHWGLTLEVANKMKNQSLNPFPRVALIKSLAKIISKSITAQ